MTHLTRRSFCRGAVLPLVASVAMPLAGSHANEKRVKRIGGSHLRVSLNAFSFDRLLRDNAEDPRKGVDLFGVCDFCAKLNIDAVDLTG